MAGKKKEHLTVVSRKIQREPNRLERYIPLGLKQMGNKSLNPKTTSRTCPLFPERRALIGWLLRLLTFEPQVPLSSSFSDRRANSTSAGETPPSSQRWRCTP